MSRKVLADPGPPLKMNVTGRLGSVLPVAVGSSANEA